MTYTEAVYVCVDELTTELLRRTPRALQVGAFSQIASEALDSKKFGEDSSRSVGSVTREQMKELLRFSVQRLPDSDAKAGVLSKLEPKKVGSGKAKTKSLCSLPVRRFREEALKGLLQVCTPTMVRDAIIDAAGGAYSRLGGHDDQGRVRREFFKPLAEDYLRLGGTTSETLVNRVGLEAVSAQLTLPAATPEPIQVQEVEEVVVAETMPLAPDTEEIDCYIPMKKDFMSIFDTYPHAAIVPLGGGLHGLAVGIASSRHPLTQKLMRRNCKVDTQNGLGAIPFSGLVSLIYFEEGKGAGETHIYIKVIPAINGTTVKFWTNFKGERDLASEDRFLVVEAPPGEVPRLIHCKSELLMSKASKLAVEMWGTEEVAE